jgi:two-component system KDP operon response regulator KdpE
MARVLIVDDDPAIRRSAIGALERAGHRTYEAPNAAVALRVVRDHRIDVVLSDIYLTCEDERTLLEALSDRSDPPRVILTTARGSETTALGRRPPAFDYIVKPFEVSSLLERVAAAAQD